MKLLCNNKTTWASCKESRLKNESCYVFKANDNNTLKEQRTFKFALKVVGVGQSECSRVVQHHRGARRRRSQYKFPFERGVPKINIKHQHKFIFLHYFFGVIPGGYHRKINNNNNNNNGAFTLDVKCSVK
jgi:hypothetical protein